MSGRGIGATVTLIVNLDTHRPLVLLPSRDQRTPGDLVQNISGNTGCLV